MNKKGKILMVAGLVCFGACVFAGPPRHHHNEGLELANGIVDLVCRVLKPAPVVVAPAPAPVVVAPAPAPVVVTPAPAPVVVAPAPAPVVVAPPPPVVVAPAPVVIAPPPRRPVHYRPAPRPAPRPAHRPAPHRGGPGRR